MNKLYYYREETGSYVPICEVTELNLEGVEEVYDPDDYVPFPYSSFSFDMTVNDIFMARFYYHIIGKSNNWLKMHGYRMLSTHKSRRCNYGKQRT